MIAHLTTVHARIDSRIRFREVNSASRLMSEEVRLYVQDGKGDEIDATGFYRVVDTGPPLRRLLRMSIGGWRIMRALLRDRPRIAHFHDPELIPWALILQWFGILVIYDVHEDVPRQMRHNPRLPKAVRMLLPPAVELVEWLAGLLLSGIVVTTPTIGRRFADRKTILIRNFPILDEMVNKSWVPMTERAPKFAYVGTILGNRGLFTMLDALTGQDGFCTSLALAGEFTVESEKAKAEQHSNWHKVYDLGWLDRSGVANLLGNVRAGLVTLHPTAHYIDALPTKLFEYMSAGLPVIASDFPLWREIVEQADCGILVDPLVPAEISQAMAWILDHPTEAEAMGKRGRQAVADRYNWRPEAEELIQFYSRM